MTTYFHASSSASLVGVLDAKYPGLHSTGDLLEHGNVPYGGENDDGVGPQGMNMIATSAVDTVWFRDALNYLHHVRSWNPEQGNRRFGRLLEEPGVKDAIYDKYAHQLLPPFNKSFFIEHHEYRELKLLRRVLQAYIERERLYRWSTLDDDRKDLVLHQFPILYEITHDSEIVQVYTGREIGLKGVIAPSQLKAYTLPECVTKIKKESKIRGISLDALSFEVLANHENPEVRTRMFYFLQSEIEELRHNMEYYANNQ